MGKVSEDEIQEIHRVMAGEEPEPERSFESGREACVSAIESIQSQEMNERRGEYSDSEWDALVPILNGQKYFNTGETDSNLSQLYSGLLEGLDDGRRFSKQLERFSSSNIVALGETPEGDELLLSDKRSNVKTKGGLHYMSRRGRNVSVDVNKDTLQEIDYRSEDINCAKLRNVVVETQKRISSGIKELENKGYETGAPTEVKENKLSTDLGLRGFKA